MGKAVELAGEISDSTKAFPKDELYVLTYQIKRAADSISLNIAEGSTGQTTPEFKKFLGYSVRSAIEVVCCIFLAKRRKIMTEDDFNIYDKKLTELINGNSGIKEITKVKSPSTIDYRLLTKSWSTT